MNQALKKCIVLVLLVMLACACATAYSADQNTSRIRIGLKLFRTILAADTKIKTKHDDNNELALAIIYKNDQTQANLYAEKLQKLGKGKNQGKIKKIPIAVTSFSIEQLQQLSEHQYAGIYIVEDLAASELQPLIDYGRKHQIIVYSPFAGAVEQGVTAGLIIEARVKPYVNNQTLKISQIQLKSFFLKVSKLYEP